MKKPTRMLVLLRMPLAVIAWFIGWGLCWIAQKNQKFRPLLSNKRENVTLTTLSPEPIMET
jgi:hypothetical protein